MARFSVMAVWYYGGMTRHTDESTESAAIAEALIWALDQGAFGDKHWNSSRLAMVPLRLYGFALEAGVMWQYMTL